MARCEHCGGSGEGSGGYNGACGYCEGSGSGACGECGYPSHRVSPAVCGATHGQRQQPRKARQ